MSDFHAGKAEYLASRIIELDRSSSSCVWTAELWVILHVQAPKPKGDKYEGFVVSSLKPCSGLMFFFCFVFLLIYFFYSMSLSEVISAPLSRSSSLRSISLFCLSLREHRYHRASGLAGNLDCGGGNGGLCLQTEAEVSK